MGSSPSWATQRPSRADEAGSADAAEREERDEAPPEGIVEEVRTLVAWSQTSASGDRADLSFEPSDRAWNMISVGPRECPGAFNCPSGGRCFAEAARDRAAAADIVVVNTHLYGAHLASGGAVLPEHDVVVFDEAHELEEVMTSSLGVEVTPGRFRAIVTAARPLVDERDRGPARLARRRWATSSAPLLGDRVGTRVLHDGRPAAGRRPRAGRAARPRPPRLTRRVIDALRRTGGQRSFLADDGDASDPDRVEPQDPDAAGRRAPGGGPAPPGGAHRRRGGLGRRHPAQRPPPPLPHRRRPGPRRDALGRGHVGADQRHHPATDRRAGRPRGVPERGAQRRQPLRLPLARAALRRPPPARPPAPRAPRRRCTRSWPSCSRPPAGARWPCSPAGGPPRRRRRRWHPSCPTRSCCRATSPRAGCSRSSPATRPRASSPRSASGRASTSRAAPCRW